MRFLVRLTICAIFCAMVVTQAALAGDAGNKVRIWGSEPLVEAAQGGQPPRAFRAHPRDICGKMNGKRSVRVIWIVSDVG
ncbi:hypothetical protein D2T29_14190 [Sinirhodobacter populi]|uniref:ABC transporter substrate-binding protein n=1 Tax=Paenirhodobacter populi TaxID=2306993 RepID=A0A443K9Z6_9RHOB|nr:hypothetical protein [Sinirhodobacter populi]RWR29565.1 hypothetical protein D2T29_14190 [Sinirhodobacter populi]